MNKNLVIAGVFISIGVLVTAAFFISNSNPSDNTSDTFQTNENSRANDNPSVRSDAAAGLRYADYSPQAFEESNDKKRVYFFHASWCPTCKVANEEFSSNPDGIPEDIVLFKTDYDTENDLKKRYGITYQHTFVQVDENGNEVAKWNGGGISELIANVR